MSLSIQRKELSALADEVETIDLGVHTGFGIQMKGADNEWIDAHLKLRQLLEDLRSGEYDHLVAYDDTRLARDQFFWGTKRVATVDGAGLLFVEEPPGNEFMFRVQRAVGNDVKRREIEKSRAALPAREERGDDQGRPPFGLQCDDDGRRWVADCESREFATAIKVIQKRDEGGSWRAVAESARVPRSTARNIFERRDRYLQHISRQDK